MVDRLCVINEIKPGSQLFRCSRFQLVRPFSGCVAGFGNCDVEEAAKLRQRHPQINVFERRRIHGSLSQQLRGVETTSCEGVDEPLHVSNSEYGDLHGPVPDFIWTKNDHLAPSLQARR